MIYCSGYRAPRAWMTAATRRDLDYLSEKQTARLLDPLFTTDSHARDFLRSPQSAGHAGFRGGAGASSGPRGRCAGIGGRPIVAQCRADLFVAGRAGARSSARRKFAIPLVKALTAAVAKSDPKAAGFVHWGATSQDAIDTGLVLQLRACSGFNAARTLAIFEHARAPRRNASSHAARRPHLAAASDSHHSGAESCRMARCRSIAIASAYRDARAMKFRAAVRRSGGHAGRARRKRSAVAAALASDLKLDVPEYSVARASRPLRGSGYHSRLARRHAGKNCARYFADGADRSWRSSAEPAESGPRRLFHFAAQTQSSRLGVILAAAIRVPALVSTMLTAMVQEHERGLGGWHAEWETLAGDFPARRRRAGAYGARGGWPGSLRRAHDAQSRRDPRPDSGESVAIALAKHMGRSAAHQLVERAAHRALESGRPFRDLLLEDQEMRKHLSPAEIDGLLDAKNYTGSARFDDPASVGRPEKAPVNNCSRKTPI